MAPPKFSKLSQSFKDLFEDDFNAGSVKASFESKVASGVNLKVKGNRDLSSSTFGGEAEVKYENSGFGVTEKVNAKSQITTELSATDKLVAGSKVTLSGVWSPNVGVDALKADAEYKADIAFVNSTFTKSILTTAVTFPVTDSVTLGVEGKVNTSKIQLEGQTVALAYTTKGVKTVLGLADGNTVSSTTFTSVTDKVDAGLQLSYSGKKSIFGAGLVASYKLDDATTFKAKVDTSKFVGLAAKHKLRDWVSIGLSANVNAGELTGSGHTFGLNLEFTK